MSGVVVDGRGLRFRSGEEESADRPLADLLELSRRHPALIGAVWVDDPSDLPDGDSSLAQRATTSPAWGPGTVLHVSRPLDLAEPLDRLWPREAWQAGARLLITIDDPDDFGSPSGHTEAGWHRRRLARAAMVRAAERIVTYRPSTAEAIAARWEIPARRIVVLDPVDRVAALAEVYSTLLAVPAEPSGAVSRLTRPPGPGAGRSERPRLAVVTPMPPATTGVADYSARLIAELRHHVTVDVYLDGTADDLSHLPSDGAGSDPPAGSGPPARSDPADPTRPADPDGDPPAIRRLAGIRRVDRLIGTYDAVVVCLGNSPYHVGALALLRTWDRPITVLAHDVRLTGLYLHGAARGAVPQGWAQVLAETYPERYPDGRAPTDDWAAETRDVLMVREVAARAERIFFTSDLAAELARSELPAADAKKVGVWAYGYPTPVHRADEGVDPCLICTFGLVNQAKEPELLLEAVAALSSSRPALHLAFVGPVGREDAAAIRQQAGQLGIIDRVVITGGLSETDYHAWLDRAAVAVQLRRSNGGETSGAVGDCVAHGVPTIVRPVGAMATLGDAVVSLPDSSEPGSAAEDLAEEIAALLDAPSQRAELGRRARAYAASRGLAAAAVTGLEVVPGLQPSGRQEPPGRVPALTGGRRGGPPGGPVRPASGRPARDDPRLF